MDQTEGEAPSPFQALIVTWAARDDRWARLPKPADEATIEAARAVRMREVEFLPPADRARAWTRVRHWYPPQHGQGVS